MTREPLPVTILKPRLSATPSTASWWKPEMISASLGSATRHIARKRTNNTTSATTTAAPARTSAFMGLPPFPHRGSGRSDVDGSGRVVLDDDHAGVLLDDLLAVDGVGEKRLGAPTDGDDDLAGPARRDLPGDTAHLTDHASDRLRKLGRHLSTPHYKVHPLNHFVKRPRKPQTGGSGAVAFRP